MKLLQLMRRHASMVAFWGPYTLVAIFLMAGPLDAQQLPMDALQQLRQLQQGQGIGQSMNDEQLSRPITLQPAVPGEGPTLPPSRLELIQSARAHAKLTQFGYDQLGSGRAVTVPQAGAIQDDYVLGPGDEIAVSLRGQENNELRVAVNRNGQVVLPRLNPVPAMGRTLGDLRRDIDEAVSRAYIGTSASVSVARVRQISVQVSGEVNRAGPRLVTGLSSVIDALVLSGGVKKTGSLRNIRIRRGGNEIPVDLYGFLTGGIHAPDVRLTDGDQIVVPPLGRTVAVTGLVRRPGIYELPAGQQGMTAKALLALAGGQEVRGQFRMSILRILPDGRTSLVPASNSSARINDSEILYVQMAADQTVSQATLAGGTGLAGSYPVAAGMRLSDMLKAPGALGPSPYTPFGIIVRKDPRTLMRTLVAFTPTAVLNGREDQILQSDDVVRILSTGEARLLNHILRLYTTQLAQDQDRIRNPLSATPNSNNSLVNQISGQNRQSLELQDLSSVPATTQRREITSLLQVPAPESPLAQQQAEANQRLAQAMQRRQRTAGNVSDGQQAFGTEGNQQQPGFPGNYSGGDALPTGYGALPMTGYQGYPGAGNPTAGQDFGAAGTGAFNPNNTQPMLPRSADERQDQNPNQYQNGDQTQNFMEQAVPAGGYASNREVHTFGQLARQLDVDPLILINFLRDHRARLDGAIRGPGSYLVGPNATLNDLVEAAGGTVKWADENGVELISTFIDQASGRAVSSRKVLPLRKGTLASYVIQPNDQFRFSQILTDVGIGSVMVQGEVRFPGTFPILRGEHLSDLLERAGGLTSTAYPAGTVYLRKSAAQQEQQGYVRAADEVENQLMVAMTRVGSSKIEPNTFTAMQSFVQELRTRQALGRISITADPKQLAADPARDPLLEAGDVVYIPPRPSTVAVLGQVLQPGNFPYRKGATVGDYIDQAGGYAPQADDSHTYIVLPNGEARRVTRSWLSFDVTALPPGSSIVVPRDVTPLDLRQTIIDVSQIFSQFAVSIASIAVLSRQ